MGEVINFAPRETREREVHFPSIIEMYSRLDELRRHSSGEAITAGVGANGVVKIDENFKPIVEEKIKRGGNPSMDKHDDEKRLLIEDFMGDNENLERKVDTVNNRWGRDKTEVENLLHFTFGDLRIDLEGLPIITIADYSLSERGKVRHIARTQEELDNPSYTFKISEKDGQEYRVQINSNGETKLLNKYVSDMYTDAGTGEETNERETLVTKLREEKEREYADADVPLTLWEKIAKLPIGKLLAGENTKQVKQLVSETPVIVERLESVENKLVAKANTEVTLPVEYPRKSLIAKNLIHLLKEGIRALEANAAQEGKMPSI